MLLTKEYDFKKNMKIIENNNQVILGNRTSGEWIKITVQCYDILKLGIEKNLIANQLIDKLSDKEDKEYFIKLFKKVDELGILKNKGENENTKIRSIDFAITNRCNQYAMLMI